MLETNTNRILMVIGSVVLFGLGIAIINEQFPEIKGLIESYFSNRVQRY